MIIMHDLVKNVPLRAVVKEYVEGLISFTKNI